MLVKLPTQLNTFENWSGFSHATVNAQMPPELEPEIARSLGSFERLRVFPTSGRISSRRNRAYWSERVSYSKLRFDPGFAPSFSGGNVPGLMKIPIAIGISFLL